MKFVNEDQDILSYIDISVTISLDFSEVSKSAGPNGYWYIPLHLSFVFPDEPTRVLFECDEADVKWQTLIETPPVGRSTQSDERNDESTTRKNSVTELDAIEESPEPGATDYIISRQVEFFLHPNHHTSIVIHFDSTRDQSDFESYSLTIPPCQALDKGSNLITGTARADSLDELVEFYDVDSHSTAVFHLLDDLKEWITIDIYFQIMNIAAQLSSDVEAAFTKPGIESFLASQLASADPDYEISSRERLHQIISLCENLTHVPSPDIFHTFRRAITIIDSNSDMDALWAFEQQYELARDYWRELFWEEKMAGLFARALSEHEVHYAKEIVESWISTSSPPSDLNTRINEVKELSGFEQLEGWKELLPYAATVSDQTFRYVSANYLHAYVSNDHHIELPRYIEVQLEKTGADLYADLGIEDVAATMRMIQHDICGHMLRDDKQYEDAVTQFQLALEAAISTGQRPRSSTTIRQLFWLYAAKSEVQAARSNYEEAIAEITKGYSLLQALADVSNEKRREYYLSR